MMRHSVRITDEALAALKANRLVINSEIETYSDIVIRLAAHFVESEGWLHGRSP